MEEVLLSTNWNALALREDNLVTTVIQVKDESQVPEKWITLDRMLILSRFGLDQNLVQVPHQLLNLSQAPLGQLYIL